VGQSNTQEQGFKGRGGMEVQLFKDAKDSFKKNTPHGAGPGRLGEKN